MFFSSLGPKAISGMGSKRIGLLFLEEEGGGSICLFRGCFVNEEGGGAGIFFSASLLPPPTDCLSCLFFPILPFPNRAAEQDIFFRENEPCQRKGPLGSSYGRKGEKPLRQNIEQPFANTIFQKIYLTFACNIYLKRSKFFTSVYF